MKAIILTIKPLHLNNIRRGKKTYELRRGAPATKAPFRVLCCESSSGGKIVAEFVADEVIQETEYGIINNTELMDGLCLDRYGVKYYLKGKNGWLIHISEMIDYCSAKGHHVMSVKDFGFERAPQGWCYVGEKK